MIYYVIKVCLTTLLIVAISEISKRSSFVGAVLASVPLISVLAMTWLYVDTKDVDKISRFSMGVFWLVIPSLTLFLTLPILLKQGLNFYLSMFLSTIFTIVSYWIMTTVLVKYGVEL